MRGLHELNVAVTPCTVLDAEIQTERRHAVTKLQCLLRIGNDVFLKSSDLL
jgi:hypothetical protein